MWIKDRFGAVEYTAPREKDEYFLRALCGP
jgi:hypothetical protein